MLTNSMAEETVRLIWPYPASSLGGNQQRSVVLLRVLCTVTCPRCSAEAFMELAQHLGVWVSNKYAMQGRWMCTGVGSNEVKH